MKALVHKFYSAFIYSGEGIAYAWRHEWAFKIEFFILLLALPFAIYFSSTPGEFVQLMSSIALLPILELLNSAIEALIDKMGEEYHILAKAAKDMASGALLLGGLNVVFTWGVLVLPRLLGF